MPVLADPSGEDVQDDAIVAIPAESAPIDYEAMAVGLQEAEAQLKAQEEERAEELESPEAVAEREASQFAYAAHDSAAEASALLQAAFPEELAGLDTDPARVITDSALKRSLDGEGAVVLSEGQPQLVETEIPTKVTDEDGDLSKVDLDLEATAEGFEPENPIIDVEIGGSPEEGVAIEGGETVITQVGVDTLSEAHLLTDKDVVYPEVQTDTDLVISPLSSGVEIFNQLRSIQSPETFRFDLDLPEGAQAQLSEGLVEIYEEGKVSAMVMPPQAVDAQGTDVPVSIELEGSTIVLGIDHREGDYAYPILLDPEYVQNDWVNASWYAGNNYHVLEDGTFIDWNNNPGLKTSRWCLYKCWGSGRGLFVSFPTNGYAANQQAQWAYFVKGETTYLTGYLINPFYRDDHGCSKSTYPEPHDFDGIWSPTYNIYYQLYTNRAPYGNASVYGNTAQSVKAMVFGLNSGGGVSLPCWRDIYAGGVATYMSDPDKPTLAPVTGFPSSWQGPGSFSVSVNAEDKGLGVMSLTAFQQGSNIVQLAPYCTGTHGSPCSKVVSGSKTLSGTQFLEGERSVEFSALDALAKGSPTQTFTSRIDRTPPKIELDGQLAMATDEEGTDEEDGKKWDKLRLPVYNLAIEATDGSLSEPKNKRSGVKDIEIFLDAKGTEEKPLSAQSCPNSSCTMTQTYQLKMAGLTAGKHTLRVIAKDQLNQSFERSIEFEYAPATGMSEEYMMHYFPLPDGTGNEAEEEHPARPELAVNIMNGNLVYREQDVEVDGPAVNLEVERYYNSMLPESEDTEWGDGWTLGQAPTLEPEEGAGTPEKGDLLAKSGVLRKDWDLPTQAGTSRFDADLQTRVTKLAGGGYELTDEGGESALSTVLDPNGKTTELRTDGYATVDYEYETGELDEIQVEDPGSVTDFAQVEEEEIEYASPNPVYKSSFGTQGTGNGQLKSPGDVAVAANGDLWVVDRANNRIQRFSSSGTYLSQFGSLGSGNGQFNRPTSIAIDTSGNLWVADANNNRIQKFSSSGTFIKAVGSYGSGNGQFSGPEGIAADAKGNVWVADTLNRRIQKFNSEGFFLLKFGSQGSGNGQFGEANSIDISSGGKIWVADRVNNRIQQFSEIGLFQQKFGTQGSGDGQLSSPYAVEVDSRGNVWVGDAGNNRVQQFSEVGAYVGKFGAAGTGDGQFSFANPTGIAVDNKGGIWVTDVSNHRIQKWALLTFPWVTSR